MRTTSAKYLKKVAPQAGLEPATLRLAAYIWTPPGCQQGKDDRRTDRNRMQSCIRPVVKHHALLATMGIRAPKANQWTSTSRVNPVIGLIQCRSDRSCHDSFPRCASRRVNTPCSRLGCGDQSRPRVKSDIAVTDCHTIRASLFSRATAALLWPRLAAVVTAHCCSRVSRCGDIRAVRWAASRTARVPCVSKQRRYPSLRKCPLRDPPSPS